MDGEGNIEEICTTSGNIVAKTDMISSTVRTAWKFSPVTADVICQKIATGMTLSAICRMDGFPGMGIIARWRAEEEMFDEALGYAESARAERYVDKIVDSVDDTRGMDKDELPAEKLYFDKLKYLAKVNDRKKYGERDQKVTAGGGNVTIQLHTGIDRGMEQVPSEVIEVVAKQNNTEE